MKKLIYAMLVIFMMLQAQIIFAAPSVSYEWGNLPIGGHGFVTGIVMHPLEKDLIYVRTDVGGAYRYDKENNGWVQLCDAFTLEDQGLYGIDGIAIDPQNTDVVYIAAGGNLGYVLKSIDRGKTWDKTSLNKYFQANGNFRSLGENIMVDPFNSSVIYCGTAREGLWKSVDGALTWTQVTGVAFTTDNNHQVRNIVFDKNSVSNGICQTIYVGETNKGIFRSLDGGNTWALLAGTPIEARRMEVGPSGALYVAAKNGLLKLVGDNWSEISASTRIGQSHVGVAVDQTNENNLMCVSNDIILRSTDGGKTWVDKKATGRFTSDIAWTRAYGNGAFSSNTCDVKIDPFNPKKIWTCDWFAAYTTDDIDALPTQTWKSPIKGMEEVVPRGGISPPSGKFQFIAAIADIDGLPYEDITQYPTRLLRIKRQVAGEPWMMSSGQIDFCEENPSIMLRAGIDWNTNGKLEYTTNNADTWNNITNIPSYVNASGVKTTAIPLAKAAVSAKINPATGYPSFVIIPAYNPSSTKLLPSGMNTVPLVSMDLGKTWQQAKGLPTGLNIAKDYWTYYFPLVSDRVNGSKFYICIENNVYVSTDWGLNWTKSNVFITGDWYKTVINTVPNVEGEVWVSMGNDGISRSRDSGKTFTKLTNVSSCLYFGFGKEAPGRTNPTMYLCGTIDGIYGLYRSLDMGATWERTNNDFYKLTAPPTFVVGDRRTFGTVYVGSGGRGIFVGKLKPSRSDYVEYSQPFSDVLGADWTLTNMSAKDGTLKKSDIAPEGLALYNKLNFMGNYKYSVKTNFSYSASLYTSRIIFNYIDKNNYYCIEFYADKVRIKKNVNGSLTQLTTFNYSVEGSNVITNVFYEQGGYITVECIKDGVSTTVFNRFKDETFSIGKVGIYTNDTATFDNLSVNNGIISNFNVNILNGTTPVTSLGSVKGQTVNVDFSIRSNSYSDVNCNVVVGVQDAMGKLQSVSSNPKTILSEDKQFSIPIKIPDDATDQYKVVVYYWQTLDNMIPLINKMEL